MKPSYILSLSLLVVLASSCSSDGNGTPEIGSGRADGGKAATCAPTPTRLIVLGDSIAACFGVDGKDAATCGPKAFASSLASGYAPGITYENLSVSGSLTTDVVDSQLATVTTGAGHVMVLIYVGGNDLQKYLVKPDAEATSGYNADLPGILADWKSIFTFFDDSTKFPDGVTIVMNTQYSPFDDCTAPPYNVSSVKNALLSSFNDELATVASKHDNAVLTDQYGPYLGHGHNYNVASCPHYQAGLVPFMNDLIHPNKDGHANLAAQWALVADGLYSGCQ